MTIRSYVSRAGVAGVVIALGLSVSGCGLTIPTDPNGTFDRVSGGVLRVGASVDNRLLTGVGSQAEGPLADLVMMFAVRHDATVVWSWGSEEILVEELEANRIDLAVGGFTANSPWSDRAAVTRGYPRIPLAEGRELSMLVPIGENRMLVELETFLDGEVGP